MLGLMNISSSHFSCELYTPLKCCSIAFTRSQYWARFFSMPKVQRLWWYPYSLGMTNVLQLWLLPGQISMRRTRVDWPRQIWYEGIPGWKSCVRLWEEGFKDARRFHYSHVAGSECSSEFLFVGAGCAPLACHKQSVILYHAKVSPKHHPMCQHKGIQRDMLPRLGGWCGGTIKPASPWCKPLFDMLEPLLFLPAWCFKPRISITH